MVHDASRGALNANHVAEIATRVLFAGGSDNRAVGAETDQSASVAGSLCRGSAARAAGSHSLSPVGAVRAVPATGETPAAGLGLPAAAGSPSSARSPSPVLAVPGAERNGLNSPPAGTLSAGGLLNHEISQECEAPPVVPPTAGAAPAPAIPAASGRGAPTRGGGTNDWPAADIARLRQLWADGLPTKQIGIEMDRSKNAIIGKANRLKLPARPDPNKWRRKNAIQQRAKQPMGLLLDPQKIGQENASMRGAPRNREMRALPLPRGQHGPARSCQWPTTDCKPWRFCDAPSLAGYSYCAGHKTQAFYQRPEQVAA